MGNLLSQGGDDGLYTDAGRIGRPGLDKAKHEKAKHDARVNSKKHAVYPKQMEPKKNYAYWHGVKVVLEEHKAQCRSQNGNTVIVCGKSGCGKSSAVAAVTRGVTGARPERLLTIKFNRRKKGDTEAEVLKSLCREFGLDEEMAPHDFGRFLVDSVWKDEKPIGKSISKTIHDLASGNWCGPNDNDIKYDAYKPTVIGLPSEDRVAVDFGLVGGKGKTKPVLVLDDLNYKLEPDGPMAPFLDALAVAGRENNVLSYMITNSQYVAYQIWLLNGGNKYYPLPSTYVDLFPRPSDWGEWARLDSSLTMEEKRELRVDMRPDYVPRFALHKYPFDFGADAKRELVLNWFGANIMNDNGACLGGQIDGIMADRPGIRVDELFLLLEREGWSGGCPDS